jgi:hypothetical protein
MSAVLEKKFLCQLKFLLFEDLLHIVDHGGVFDGRRHCVLQAFSNLAENISCDLSGTSWKFF